MADDDYLTPVGSGGGSDETVGVGRRPGRARATARVGQLEFATEYADPRVGVDQERRTVEHDLVSSGDMENEYLVQDLGQKPSTITVNGIIREESVDYADALGGEVYIRTERWTGVALVKSVTTDPRNALDSEDWLYDVTIELTAIKRDSGVQPNTPETDSTRDYSPYE